MGNASKGNANPSTIYENGNMCSLCNWLAPHLQLMIFL